MVTLTLYGRTDCHLCDEMLHDLGDLLASAGLVPGKDVGIERIDIDTSQDIDPDLRERLTWNVPVLSAGDTELCRHRLDYESILEFLNG